jgi:hypothetical protein
MGIVNCVSQEPQQEKKHDEIAPTDLTYGGALASPTPPVTRPLHPLEPRGLSPLLFQRGKYHVLLIYLCSRIYF